MGINRPGISVDRFLMYNKEPPEGGEVDDYDPYVRFRILTGGTEVRKVWLHWGRRPTLDHAATLSERVVLDRDADWTDPNLNHELIYTVHAFPKDQPFWIAYVWDDGKQRRANEADIHYGRYLDARLQVRHSRPDGTNVDTWSDLFTWNLLPPSPGSPTSVLGDVDPTDNN